MQRRNLRSRKKPKSSKWKALLWLALTVGAAVLIFIAAGPFIGGAGLERSLPEVEQEPEFSEPPGEDDPPETTAKEEQTQTPQEMLREQAESIVEAMTLDEKICQLFMVTPEQLTGVGQVTAAGDGTRQALLEYPVGGLIYFRQNLQTPDQTRDMLEKTKAFSEKSGKLPLFLAVDEEGGSVARIGGQEAFGETRFPDMAEIGANGDPQEAYEVGNTIGAYLSGYGFNMDFAPDADVLTNPENTVVANRSFGSDPQLVWQMASQVATGLEEQGIWPVWKHFPGHGATAGDTHEGFAYTDQTLEELWEEELLPFRNAVEAGADCVMAAHIAVPAVTGDDTPASLSETMIDEILRQKMGFEGVVVTDALNMGAIQDHYSSGEAAVKALKAGADLLLMPSDFHKAKEAVAAAVENGELSQERIDQSVIRIGIMKLKRQQYEEK